jgi:hypothetical protein
MQRLNEAKTWFFEKLTKNDKLLVNLTKRRREKMQINKIKTEKEDVIANINEI